MKQAIVTSYTFSPSARTLDLSSISGFNIELLYAVINVSANQLIYATGQPSFGLASISGSVLTLVYNTTSMSAGDSLMIIYETTASASSVSVSNFPATQAVSAAALPLPANAAQESGGHLASLDGKVPSLGQAVAASSTPVVLPAAQVTALTPPTSVGVNNFPATQPVSAAALPLPANAAQETGGHLASLDTKTPSLGQAVAASSAPVVLPAAQITALTPPTSVGVNNFPATQAVSAAALPLPANAAQETGGHLASLDTKTPALGQAAAAASTPVVLPPDATPATLNITVQDTGSTSAPMANNQNWISGTPTVGSVAIFPLGSNESGVLQLAGTWTGTLQVEVSVDGGVTYTSHSIHQYGSPIFASSFTANVVGSLNLAGKSHVRVRATAAMTGTAIVRVIQSANASSIYVANAIKLVDGTTPASTTQATIKPASTPAAATDTALVVALNPGSPVNISSTVTPADFSTTNTLAAANATVVLGVNGVANALVQLSGTWVGTIAIEASVDNFATYNTMTVTVPGSTATSTPLSANGFYKVLGVSSYVQIRARMISYTSGSANVTIRASGGNGVQAVVSTVAGNFLTTTNLQDAVGNAIGSTSGALNVNTINGATAANQATMISSLSAIATNTGASAQDFITSGTIAANAASVQVTGQGVYTVSVSISGTWVGTLFAQGQLADGTWKQLPVSIITSTLPYASAFSISANGAYLITAGGYQNIRIFANAWTSGTASVALEGSLAQQTIYSAQLGSWNTTVQGSSTAVPYYTDSAIEVRPVPLSKFRTTFSKFYATGADPGYFTTVVTGAGQTVSQSAGNLVVTSGTTANSETIVRSLTSWNDSINFRWANSLSQRIVNQNFFVELVDVIGDGLATTVNSATSITVTIPSNPFTAVNVGQAMYVGNVTGISAAIPGRYVIASVSGSTVTFTVAGWPATGIGTVSLFGWNYYQALYNGTTATAMSWDTQQYGWNSGFTAATINTTASPGHMGIMVAEDGNAALLDRLTASSTTVPTTLRANRIVNVPASSAQLFLQFRSLNGSTAPASTTTWTIQMTEVDNYAPQAVSIHNIKPQGIETPLNTSVSNITTGTLASVATVSTVTTVGTVSAMTSGNLGTPSQITDVASAALTTTTTTATLTPTFGVAYQVNIPVTVVSGTGATLDVEVQESRDGGVNWIPVYDFPRINSIGSYNSPVIPFTGNRVRYVQTVSGTTPSFTRAINRLQSSLTDAPFVRQIVDRTIVLTTAGSSTVSLNAELQTKNVQMVVNVGAITTTAPALQIQASDDFGNSWYNVGASLTAVANSSVQLTVTSMASSLFKVTVATAGVGVTAGYVLLRTF